MWDLAWLIQRIFWIDVLDIFLVAVLFFWLFYAIQGTRAVPLIRGATALLIVLAVLTRLIQFRAFSWLIEQLFPALLIAVPVLFQPELRRALEQLGRAQLSFLPHASSEQMQQVITAVVDAATYMANRGVGALIVFERQTGLQEYIETGVYLDAEITSELLTTIFDHHTILHDGAVIICHGRLRSAASVMPLTAAFLSDRELGLRHRAAIGITEESDAVVVVVSEERGAISLTHNGRIIRDIDPKRLDSILRAFLLPKSNARVGAFNWVFRRKEQKAKSEQPKGRV